MTCRNQSLIVGCLMVNEQEANKKTGGAQIERQLRGVFILIVFLWLLGIIFVSKRVTMTEVYFVFSRALEDQMAT
jgi:hypothetical protein